MPVYKTRTKKIAKTTTNMRTIFGRPPRPSITQQQQQHANMLMAQAAAHQQHAAQQQQLAAQQQQLLLLGGGESCTQGLEAFLQDTMGPLLVQHCTPLS